MITNFNGMELLEKILPSVMNAANYSPGSEVVVVDDKSSDKSIEMLQDKYSSVRILALEKNVGFQQASNKGVEFCKNRLVICLNNDMMVNRDCCEALGRHFDDPKVFAVSTRVLLWDKKTYLAGRRYAEIKNGNLILNDEDCPVLAHTLFATGGGCMLDRDKFLKLKGFDKLYAPLYWEDIDLSYRAWKRGFTVLYDPSVVFYHKEKATIAELMTENSIRYMTGRNSYLFFWKNISDKTYFRQHISRLAPNLLKNILDQNYRFPVSFLKTLPRLPDTLMARKAEKKESSVNDMAIIENLKNSYTIERYSSAGAAQL